MRIVTQMNDVGGASNGARSPHRRWSPKGDASKEWLRRGRDYQQGGCPIDALICSGDYFAHGALLWCLRHQVAVPQRVAIAGMGDLELSAQLTPALSTVHFNGYEIGRRAATKLLARLDGRSDGPPVEDSGFRIVLREST